MSDKIKIEEITNEDYVGVIINSIRFKVFRNKIRNGYSIFDTYDDIDNISHHENKWVEPSKIKVLKRIKQNYIGGKGKWFYNEELLNDWVNGKD